MARCNVCFHRCEIPEGGTGFCGARVCRDGVVRPGNYGGVTALALDPVEKKPLRRFRPGSRVLSVGSYGCNLRCPFCQNHDISWSREALGLADRVRRLSPEALVECAVSLVPRGNIGLAFTYNEPLIGWEYVRDAAALSHEASLVNVLVTNGTASPEVLKALEGHIDAMNIDLKGFTEGWYKRLGGSLDVVKAFIEGAVGFAHVELTALIVPSENDSEAQMRRMTAWIAGLDGGRGERVPLHISRFFPRFHMADRPPTDVKTIYRLAEVARERLRYVYTGNC